ncbi:MAG: hypothetical protein LBU76_02990 [Azoarcus sp.]|nr:hypothetical protein [Azoarcus sp.]
MNFHDPNEKEHNAMTKKLHELSMKGSGEHAHGLDTTKTHKELVKLYNKIHEKEKTAEQTQMAVAALILLNKNDEARLLLDKWQNIGKEDRQWNTQYAWSYYMEKDYRNAIPYFSKVEDLLCTDTIMVNYLLECNEKVGNKEEITRLKNRIKELYSSGSGDRGKYKKENYYKNK